MTSEERLQKFHTNDNVSLGTEILVELLIGGALRQICFNQLEALTAQTWLVTRHRHGISDFCSRSVVGCEAVVASQMSAFFSGY